MDNNLEPPLFGGQPGTAVPEVDAADVAATWKVMEDVRKCHPNGGVSIDIGLFKQVCKDGADVKAIAFRSMMVSALRFCAQDQWEGLTKSGDLPEQAFLATARVPMQWISFRVRMDSLPFDPELFFRMAKGES